MSDIESLNNIHVTAMNVKEITEGVYYAGVNDRVTALFEVAHTGGCEL